MTVVDPVASVALDHSVIRGTWANTNANGSIATITVRDDDEGRLWIEATGRLRDGVREWGRVEGHAYGFNFEDRVAGAFDAVWDLGFIEIRMQANVKLGVLVVVTLSDFRDDSGRSSYFDREFYHRVSV